jgi:hypothetical protein
MVNLEVHRQRGSQVAASRVHLAADCAATRAGGAIGREESSLRPDLIEVFPDGQGVPDLDAVMQQPGDQDRRREEEQFRPIGGIVDGDGLLLEVEAGHSGHQPTPQGPGRVVPAADGEGGLRHRNIPFVAVQHKL